MIRGIDISAAQSDFTAATFAKAKAAGCAFVIVKATQAGWTDGQYTRLLGLARAAGMVLGSYHFLVEPGTHGNAPSASVQARAFVNAVKARNGGTLDGMLLCLDVEPYQDSSPSWGDVRTWVAAFRKLAGNDRPLFIYTRAGVWASYKNPRIRAALGNRTYLWNANWTLKAGAAWGTGYGGIKTVIHQHGPFPGLRPDIVDGDVFAGSVAQLKAYTRPKVEAPEPPAEGPDPTSPPTADRWAIRSLGAPLRRSAELEPEVSVAYGVPLQVAGGPTGAGPAPGGAPSGPFLVVTGLLGRQLDPPLLVLEADVQSEPTPRPSTPASPQPLPPEGGP